MSPESSFSCSDTPSLRKEKGILERADEFLTFREESLRKLEEKRKREQDEIRKETAEACRKERAEFATSDFRKVDLGELGSIQETIGRKGTVRKLLFGMNGDIVKTNGTIGSVDERTLRECDKTNRNTPICKQVRSKTPEQIRLSGEVMVNFRRNLDEAWQHKMRDWSNAGSIGDIRSFYEKEVRPFTRGEKDFTGISRKDYEKEVRDSIASVRSGADFDKGFAAYGISSR